MASEFDEPVPVRPEHVAWAEVDGEAVLFDTVTGDVHRLDAVATVVWACLDGNGTLDELCHQLADGFRAGIDDVRADLTMLLADLTGKGLLGAATLAPPGESPRARSDLLAVTRAALNEIDWSFQSATFAGLDFRFAIRTNDVELGRYLSTIFAPLEVDGRRQHLYSILDRGDSVAERRRFATYFDDERIDTSLIRRFVVDVMIWHVNRQTVASSSRYLLLHAGAVARDGQVIIFPAPQNSGKSTLVTALLQAGFDYVSDEAVAIDPDTLLVHPFPKALTLDRGSWPLFPDLRPSIAAGMGEDVPASWHIDPRDISAIAPVGTVRAIVAVRHDAGRAAHLERVSSADAMVTMLENCFNARRHGPAALETVAGIARGAKGHRLVSGGLSESVELVRQVISR